MSLGRAALLLVLLAALAWPAQAVALCPELAPAASCCCPPAPDGGDGCGPAGCCCVRDGAPAEPKRPEPPTPAAPGHHEFLPLPAPVAAALPAEPPAIDPAGASPLPSASEGPALFVVLCTFRC